PVGAAVVGHERVQFDAMGGVGRREEGAQARERLRLAVVACDQRRHAMWSHADRLRSRPFKASDTGAQDTLRAGRSSVRKRSRKYATVLYRPEARSTVGLHASSSLALVMSGCR